MEICLIDAEGLDEEIRCVMCRNPMRSDTGCDGGCTYDEKLYEKIVHLLNERIKPLPSIKPQPDSKESSSTHKALDTISRQVAIDAIGKKADEIYKTKQKGATYPHDAFFQGMAYAESIVKQLPSAQPETEERNGKSAQNVPKEDLISRKAAIEAAVKMFEAWYGGSVLRDREIRAWFEALPAAEPGIDEWCTDCSEYDHERHCCPRWNRVIRETLKDAQPERRTDDLQ